MKKLPGTLGKRLPFHFKLQLEQSGSQTLMHEYRGKVRGPLLTFPWGMIWSFPHESLTKRGEGSGGCREGTSKLPHSGHQQSHQQRTSVCSGFHCLRMLPAGHASTAPAAARPGPPRILWHSCKTPAIGHLGQSVQKERG